MTKPSSCPSEFALERWRFGELAASEEERQLVTHVASCPTCRARQAELAASEQPRLDTEQIWVRSSGPPVRKPWWSARRWQGAVLAAAAVALLIFLPRPKTPDTLTKGAAWQLAVIAKARDGRVLRVDPGASLSPGDQLRFEVATSWPRGDVALVMLDSAGKVTQLAPAGEGAVSVAGGKRTLLDEAVELDGVLGPERIVLVGCKHPIHAAEVMASAERALAAAHNDPRQVGTLGTGCHEESFWISKVSQ
jgi:hypothetical protein